MIRRGAFAAAASSALLAALTMLELLQPACAQSYPERTVRIIVPTAAGGSIDTTARVVAVKLNETWGKPVVIENRPGAAMIIGADAAARSAPEMRAVLAGDMVKWGRLVKEKNIQIAQ